MTKKNAIDEVYQDHYQNIFDRPEAVTFFSNLLSPHLPEDKSVSILDVGCGTGLGMEALKSLGYENVQGLDINTKQVDAAQKKGLIAHCVKKTSAWIEGLENSLDFVVATDVLEHMDAQEREEVLTAIRGKLKTGGHFLCTVPNANSSMASRWRYIDLTHQISFTESSLRTLLQSGGFQEFTIKGSDPFLIFDGPSAQIKRGLSFALRKTARSFRRLEMIAELGPDEGLHIPLNINLLALVKKTSD